MGYVFRSHARLGVAALIVVVLVQLSAGTGAQARGQKSTAPRAVKRLYREGQAHYYAGRYRQALELFRRAVRIHPHPSIFLAIAQTYRKLDKLLGALSYYRRYKQAVDESAYADIDEKIKEVEGEMARRAAAERLAQQAVLSFSALPAGATLRVDGAMITVTDGGGGLRLDSGAHQLLVRAPGYQPWSQRIELAPRQNKMLEVKLVPLPPAASPARSWLIAGILSSAVAVGLEATALAFTAAANDEFNDTSAFDRYRATVIAGHVLAVLAAGAAVASWMLYFKRRNEQTESPSSVQIVPAPGGVIVSAHF